MTQETVQQYIKYDSRTGEVRRLICTAPRHKLNEVITYEELVVYGVRYQLTSLIWLYHYGSFPTERIIKLDGNVNNLAIENLVTKSMLKTITVTQEIVKKYFNYDQETGILTWKLCTNSSNRIGSVAGSVSGTLPDGGYVSIGLFGKQYKAHRLIWLYVYGYWPKEVDHIDQCRTNNSLCNLREVITTVNMKNKSLYKNNSSGVCGVYKKGNKWAARINGKKNYLGTYATIEEAISAREAANIIFNYHENHGRMPNDYPIREYTTS